MGNTFGDEVQQRRHALGLSLHDVAARVPCSVGYLSRIEHGQRTPTPETVAALDNAVHARGALTLLAEQIRSQEAQTKRREVIQGLAAAGMVAAGWPLPTVPADIPRRIGMQHVEDVQQATAMYRAWVARHGGAGVREAVGILLSRASAMYANASEPAVRKSLLGAIADLAGLGGYVARDVGAHNQAEEHFRVALSAATSCRDGALAAYTVVRMAGHGLELRQPERVLTLLQMAATQRRLGPADRANQACLRAWGHAQAGDVDGVRRAVGEAEEQHARAAGAAVAGWAAQHVTDAELYSLTGAAYVDLARRDRDHVSTAIDRLTKAIDLRGATVARNRTLDMISLSEAYLLDRQLDEAGRTALCAKAARESVTSSRLELRLGALRRQLRPHAGRSESVAEFLAT